MFLAWKSLYMVDKMIYDKDKDIALAFGHLDLGTVINVLKEKHVFKGVRVEGFGFGTTSESARPALMALRAAHINAYDELAQVMYPPGLRSSSSIPPGGAAQARAALQEAFSP